MAHSLEQVQSLQHDVASAWRTSRRSNLWLHAELAPGKRRDPSHLLVEVDRHRAVGLSHSGHVDVDLPDDGSQFATDDEEVDVARASATSA